MFCVRFVVQITALLAVIGLAVPAANAEAMSPFMHVVGPTTQPIGHHDLCSRMPAECRERTASDQPVHLTPERWNLLIAINDNVNTAIQPDTDKDIYGKDEYWAYPDAGKGDCEDYVLLKRRELMEHGWPAGSLLITVVRQTNGDGHAILTVRTDRGDLVLDNLEGKILLWSHTDYQFIKRQSDTDSGRWVSIDDGRAPLVGSIAKR